MHYIDVYITATVNEPVLCGSTPPLNQLEPALVDSLPSSPILSSLASPPPNEYMRELEDSALHKDALDHDLQSVHDEPIKPVYSNPESFQKIYNGSNISVCGFNCMVMKFANKHNLTYSAIGELLELLNIICPRPNEIPTSIYKLKKFFKQFENNSSCSRIFCANCKIFEDEGRCTCKVPNKGHMVSTGVEKPLQAILSGKCDCHV